MLGLIRGGFISDDKRTVVKIKQIASFSHKSATGMCEIKYTYFDLRVKGEAPRFLLAYGGLKYVNERSENFEILLTYLTPGTRTSGWRCPGRTPPPGRR